MQRSNHWLMTLLLYLMGFMLFWEWLRPLSVITKTGDLNVFVMYAAFAFLLSYLQLPIWISAPAKVLAMLYALHSLFFFKSLFDLSWLSYLFKDIQSNSHFLISGDWSQMTDLFRSLLFFVLLWLVSYLMHYWLIQARKVFLFFLVTILYVTIIDTFTSYDATWAIVRTVIIGFLLLGLLRFIKLQEEERIHVPTGKFPMPWVAVLVVILLISTGVGLATPKAKAQWPDPVPFLQSTAQKYGGGVGTGGKKLQQIGFSKDDSRLGGSFINNKTPLFSIATGEESYWRVATKSIYTGKGWEAANKGFYQNLNLDKQPQPDLYLPGTTTKKVKATVKLAKGRSFSQLVYGGELTRVNKPNNVKLRMDQNTEEIKLLRNGNQTSLSSYSMVFLEPEFTVKQLEKPGDEPQWVKDNYLDLPYSLPDKVRKLTEKITAHAKNRYQQVKAVENYLHSSRFTYATKNIPVPGKNQDYVAQFLFDSHRGYCNNFSTSMAVMLRTIGIPTRWVKGFSPGQYQKTLNNGQSVYQITNANAHSWVEVYFPDAGWVPFEPTKGFSGDFNIVQQVSGQSASSNRSAGSTPTQQQLKNKQLKGINPQLKKELGANGSNNAQTGNGHIFLDKWLWIFVIGLLLAAGILFQTRRRWLPRLVRAQYANKSGNHVFPAAYKRLMKLLPLYGLSREQSMTLREYAEAVDRELEISEMKQLTANYESILYRKEASQDLWQDSKGLWEVVIQKLMIRK